MEKWKYNPKTQGSGIITCIPQTGLCPVKCDDCFFQSGRSYLEPLDENLPHIPTKELAKGRVARINDGNDSNNNRELVIKTAEQFDDYFFNTSIPKIDVFDAPVVLTANPSKMTDNNFHKLDPIPKNLMFVRARVNLWNVKNVVDGIVEYYTKHNIPVILTFMAYYSESIPSKYKDSYVWKKRTINSYYVLKQECVDEISSVRRGKSRKRFRYSQIKSKPLF